MKVQLFCLFLVISSLKSPLVMAENLTRSPATQNQVKMLSSSLETFNSKWNYGQTITHKNADSSVHTKLFKRYMWIKKVPVALIETTYVFLENPKGETKLDEIAANVNRSFGNSLKITKNKKSYVIEGDYKKSNKYMLVELVENKKSISVITSSIRLGLKNNLIPEAKELHNVLANYSGNKNSKSTTTSFINNLIINKAFAIDFGDISDIINGSNTITSTLGDSIESKSNDADKFDKKLEKIEDAVLDLNKNLDLTNSNWGDTNTQLGGINSNWSNTNTTLIEVGAEISKTGSALNLNWDNSNKTIKEASDNLGEKASDLNDNWAKTNNEIEKANKTAEKFSDEYENMNGNWAESNKILAKAMDPKHMAKVAFYTAAGAALGGVAVNLAVQGISEGISFLHELFTGAKEKKLEWADFQKAMDVWDTKLNDLVKMEQLVDGHISAFNFFENKNLGNDYEKQLALTMRDMRFDRDLFLEKFKDQDLAIECRKLFFDASDELDQQIKSYEKIIQFANNQNISMDGANYFCSQLKDLQRKILLAETQMQDVRLKILRAENQFYNKEIESIESRDTDIAKINSRLASTLKEKKEFEKAISERLNKKTKQTKSEWLSDCMDGKNIDGKRIKEDLKGSFFIISYFKKRNRCSNAYTQAAPLLIKADEEEIRSASLEEQIRRDLEIKQNIQVELNLSQDQINWMSRIHLDAYCYQFTHQPGMTIPPKCSEFPEMLYSLSMARGYDKAKAAYDSKCQDRYIKGLENLVKNLEITDQ